jgi:creatinine amidohydrolase
VGNYLEHYSWREAEQLLSQGATLLLPIGARLKEHGLHLPLNNDWLLAEYLTRRLVEQLPVLALPTVPYGYYPAFVEYPGSINIARDTFRDTVCDICRSLARHGGRRIYALNTGISTNWALEPARLLLQGEGIAFEFSDLHELLPPIVDPLREQPQGTHADEIETSMMLYICPERVRMDLAERDIDPRHDRGRLTRQANSPTGVYSQTGAWGDPTLATTEKGRIITELLVSRLVEKISEFSQPEYSPADRREKYLS